MRSRIHPFSSYPFNLNRIRLIFGEHRHNILKSWIDLNYRMIRTCTRRQFLLQCKYNIIFPAHLMNMNNRFHLIHYKSTLRFEKTLHNFRTSMLNIEIFDLNRIIDSLTKKLCNISRILSDSLPTYIWNNITNYHFHSFNKLHTKLHLIYKKKISWLLFKNNINKITKIKPIHYYAIINNGNHKITKASYRNPTLTNNETLVNIKIEPLNFLRVSGDPLNNTNKSWFVNLSNSHIPSQVSNLLQFGEKFSLPSLYNKKQSIHEIIKDVESNIKSFHIENQTRIRNIIIPQFHRFLHTESLKNTTNEKLIALHNYTIDFQRKNPEIIYTRADKGNITVALNKMDYFKKMDVLLEDTKTYSLIKKDPSITIEKKLNEMIKKWFTKEYITKRELLQLRSSDSLLPKAYGLPKLHKVNVPLRLIVSSINTSLYPIAKFLNKIISDSIPHTDYQAKNSFDLCKALSNKNIPTAHSLFSLDVVSLFTNVPLNLALDGIGKRWEYIQQSTKISKEDFMVSVEFVLSSTYFTFGNRIYKQIFGTPMGSPLSPIVADIVMRDLEENILNSLNIRPILYYRYVDDIILTAPKDEIQLILDRFNSYHYRLKFTLETEVNHCLNFLDITLIRKDTKIITDWFHKSTFSGRYLSFFSNHPTCHKVGTIYSLVDHAIKLSHPTFHEKNLGICINLLLDNGYPLNLIFNKINSRLKKLFVHRTVTIPNVINTDNNSNNEKRIIVLPYVSPLTDLIMSNIDSSKTLIGLRCLNKLSRLIKVHKDIDKPLYKNNVVYKIHCRDCEATYVGQTKRQLKTRLKEHRNNIKLDQSKHSVISEHITKYNHSFDWENTKIIDYESRYYKRIISEMIHIKEQKVSLNLKSDTDLLDDSYFDILNELINY